MRFQYRHPRLYGFLIWFLYSNSLLKRINKLVGKNVSVFEPAAGYGRIGRILDPSVTYRGIDLNEYFVRYAQSKKINVKIGDILDPSNYIKSDVMLIVDIVHHFDQKQLKKFFDIVFTNAKRKVIIVDPSFMDYEKRYGPIGKFIDKMALWIDNDGFNVIHRWFSTEEYEKLFTSRFNSTKGKRFKLSYEQCGAHHIACYTV